MLSTMGLGQKFLLYHFLSFVPKFIIILNIKMLGIALTSEVFQRLLFKTQFETRSSKTLIPAVLTPLKPQLSKKNKIVIISNGVQQNKNKPRRKRYVFSQEEIAQESSEVVSHTRQKKHLIKKQKKEDPDYSVKRQKNDRNVVSNIVHHLMKHTASSVPQRFLRDMFDRKNIKISLESFFRILDQKDKMCKTYITNKHLRQLWNDPSQSQFSEAMRILSRLFLQNYSFLTIFNGNKLNRESKAIHYKGRRDLIQFLSKLK